MKEDARDKMRYRLYGLLDLQKETEDFEFYKKMAVYLEKYYAKKGIRSDIFYIDITMEEPIYGVPFNIKV